MEPKIGDVAADSVYCRAARYPFNSKCHAGWESLVENHFVETDAIVPLAWRQVIARGCERQYRRRNPGLYKFSSTRHGLIYRRRCGIRLPLPRRARIDDGAAELVPEAAPDFARMKRHFFATSSCGICGKASIDSIRSRLLAAPNPDFRLDAELLITLPDALRSSQDVFQRTGGLHAAALFDPNGKLLVLREDIGRHNAVDKVIGWALLEGRVPLSDSVLLVSGRGGFEIVQKAIVAGVPVVASVSAPSSLAVQLARELHQTLIGFLRGRRFVIYAGEERMAGKTQKV